MVEAVVSLGGPELEARLIIEEIRKVRIAYQLPDGRKTEYVGPRTKGVGQGLPSSSLICVALMERVSTNTLKPLFKQLELGIAIGETNITHSIWADNIWLYTNNQADLQDMFKI